MPGFSISIDTSRLQRDAERARHGMDQLTIAARDTQQGMDGVSGAASRLSAALKIMGAVFTAKLAADAFGWTNAMRRELVRLGSEAQETANKFAVVFSSVRDGADKAVEKLRNFYGMSKKGAQEALSGTADLLQGLGISQQKALELSMQVATLGTDMASFSNYAGGAKGASEALTKALLGETEAAKALGVVLGEDQMKLFAAQQGLDWSKLDLAAKAQLRLNAAIAQSPNAIGDFQRSMDSYANQVRVAEAVMEDFRYIVGEGLVGAHAAALSALNGHNGAMQALAETISGFLMSEGDGVVEWLKSVTAGEDGAADSTEVLAAAFVQCAGAAKLFWNGIQLVVDAIAAIVNACVTGIRQLNLLGDALGAVMRLDFGAAKKAMQEAGQAGSQMVHGAVASFSTDAQDLQTALDMMNSPGKFVGQNRRTYRSRTSGGGAGSSVPATSGSSSSFGGSGGSKKKSGTGRRSSGSGAGGASQVESARERIQALREEVQKLNGETAGNSLDKKLREIEQAGQKAKLPLQDIAALKDEYTKAFQGSVIRDFNKALLEVTGSAEEIRAAKIEETLEGWRKKFVEAKLSAEEIAPKLTALREGLAKKASFEDLQAAVSFYKELGELSGNYTLSIEKQNELLERQAELHKRNGIPPDLVDEWLNWKKLENATDWLSGLRRGMMSMSKDAQDWGRSVESIWTSAADSMTDAFVSFCTTGKGNFKDMANSIISDLIRMITKAMIIQPLMNALGTGISGLFGGGSSTFDAMPKGGPNVWTGYGWSTTPHALGGIRSGGTLSAYANRVVSRPTLFSFDTVTPFARGGIMGEAGPEAIMPLTRMSNGRLGVQSNGGNASGGAMQMQLTIVDKTSGGVGVENAQASQDGMSMDMLVNQIEQGIVRRASSGRSPLMNFIDKTRGTSNARRLY